MATSGWVRSILFLIGSGVVFVAMMYLFSPLDRVNKALDGQLALQGLRLSPPARKSLLPGLYWERPTLSSSQGALLHFDHLSLHPDWEQLLLGVFALSSKMTLGSGTLALSYGVTGSRLLDIKIHDMNLEEIPLFKTVLGARAAGSLWSEGSVVRGKNGVSGDVKIEIKNLSLAGVKLGLFPLPDVSGLKAQGMLKIAAGKGRLESLTLQGEGIYMRLSGDLPSGSSAMTAPINLSLEIMPKPEFLEQQKLVFMLLAKFATSPGVYQIPVRGTLLKPEIL